MEPGTSAYPVSIDITQPERFDRAQVILRMLVGVVFAVIHLSTGGVLGLAYLLLPCMAALLISQRGSSSYLQVDSPWLIGLLDWLLGFYAYMMFVTDRFPLDPNERASRLHVSVAGTPSVKSALMRLLTSLPHFVLLLACGIASCIIAVIAAISILSQERYPDSLREFQRNMIVWSARLLAYHASLVDVFPPSPLFARSSSQHDDRSAQGLSQP